MQTGCCYNQPIATVCAGEKLFEIDTNRKLFHTSRSKDEIADCALSMEVSGLPTMITHAPWSIRISAHSGSNRGGSALECAACLDVLVVKSLVQQTVAMEGKEMLIVIVSMLVGLIRSNSPNRDA